MPNNNKFNIKILIILFFGMSPLLVLSQISDSCLPKGFLKKIDTSINYKFRINNIDFTDNNEKIVIADDPGSYNIALLKKDNKWVKVFGDSIEHIDKLLKYSAKRISDYIRIKDKLYFLGGGPGYSVTYAYDSTKNKLVYVDTLKAKAYIKIADLNDSNNVPRIILDEYYANKIFYFDNYGWLVVGRENIYKYSKDFTTLYEKLPNKPIVMDDFTLYDSTRWYADGLCHAISQDTIFFSYIKYLNKKNSAIRVYEIASYKTYDGCKTFEKINLPIDKLGYFYFFDSKTGFYSGQYYYYNKEINNVNLKFFVFKTIDGGLTWEKVLFKDNNKININDPYNKILGDHGGYIKFYNNNKIGVIVSALSEVYLSNDYGNSWNDLNPYDKNDKCENRIWNLTSPHSFHNDTLYLFCSREQTYYTYHNPVLSIPTERTDLNNHKIYPNPVSAGSKLKILQSEPILDAVLHNIVGMSQNLLINENEIEIPSYISSGIYYLHYKSGDKIYKEMIIVM